MEFIWEVPDEGYVKINIHCVLLEVPMPNGNRIGIAAIIRNDKGEMLWGCLGTLPGSSEEQAILSALQSACIHAHKKEWDLVHIETDNHRVYDTLRNQHHILLDEDQVEIYKLFNTLHANTFRVGKSKKCITHVPVNMNATAEYMANYGLENLKELVEISKPFGNLDYFLQRDLGFVLAFPYVEVVQNMGDGEVIDGPAPPPVKKRKLTPSQGVCSGSSLPFRKQLVRLGGLLPDTLHSSSFMGGVDGKVLYGKGKGKANLEEVPGLNFSGTFSAAAIRLLNSGCDLSSILAAPKAVLQNALLEAWAELLPKGGPPKFAFNGVDDVSAHNKATIQVLELLDPVMVEEDMVNDGASTSGTLSDF